MDCQSPSSFREGTTNGGFRVRVAAIGDLHVRGSEDQTAFPQLDDLSRVADLLLVAGDLTENGRMLEAEAAGDLLSAAKLPVIAVLGNHDLRTLRRSAFRRVLERRGVEVLEGTATVVESRSGYRVGNAGTTGICSGFLA